MSGVFAPLAVWRSAARLRVGLRYLRCANEHQCQGSHATELLVMIAEDAFVYLTATDALKHLQ